MKSCELLKLVIFTGYLSSFAFAGPSLADLQQVMPKNPERPYLHFSKKDLPAMRERVKTEPRAKAVYQTLLMESRRLLDTPVPLEVPRRFRGISPYFEEEPLGDYVSSLGRNCYVLAFIYQMTGDEKYARKSYQFAEALAALDSWVATWDKFPFLYWSGKPYGAKWNEDQDNEIVYSFDLDTAAICRQLGATYDWIYPALNEYERKTLRSALLENGILRVRGNYDYHWWAHSWRTNWLPLAFSGLGIAALALYPEDPQLLDVVEETRVRLNRYLEEAISLDGGYQEGVGNWSGSIQTILLLAAALKNVSEGKLDLFKHPKLSTTIQFPLYTFTPPQGSVPFGDSFEPLRGSWELYNKLAEEMKSPHAKWLAQFFHSPDAGSSSGDPFSIIWPEAKVKASLPDMSQPMSMHFRTIDWVIMRASWENVNYPLLAAKGGVLDDPQHGHLDAGQFAIHYRGEWYVRDLGYMAPSDFGYWDYRRRFKDYIHANSIGHNLVFVNGERQEHGKEYFAKVTLFKTSESQDYAVIDVSKAYPGKELKGWKRHILYQKPYFIVLLDEVESARGSEIAVRIHPGVSFSLNKNYVWLKGDKGTMVALPLSAEEITLKSDRHPILPRQRDAKLSWIPFYDLVIKASSNKTHIVNVFAPVEDEAEAQKLSQSSKVILEGNTLNCQVLYKGKQYSSTFDLSGTTAELK